MQSFVIPKEAVHVQRKAIWNVKKQERLFNVCAP